MRALAVFQWTVRPSFLTSPNISGEVFLYLAYVFGFLAYAFRRSTIWMKYERGKGFIFIKVAPPKRLKKSNCRNRLNQSMRRPKYLNKKVSLCRLPASTSRTKRFGRSTASIAAVRLD